MCLGGIWRFCDLVACIFVIFQDTLKMETDYPFMLIP